MSNKSHEFKNSIYIHLSRIGKALSSPKRLYIIDLLCEGSKTVETISKETGMSFANTSSHLQTLLEARLVEFEKKGLYSYYQLSDSTVASMFHDMQALGENLIADIQKLIEDSYVKNSDIEQVDSYKSARSINKEKLNLSDVRS